MSHEIREAAADELRAAAEWYENEGEGLGAALVEEFERALDDALRNLEIGAVVGRAKGGEAIRRYRLRRFTRYAVYVVVLDETLTVVAFEHASRRPGYWLRRIG